MVKIVNLIILFYTLSLFGCAPKTEIIDRYDNGRIKLTRDYKVIRNGLSSDSTTTKLIRYYRNGSKFYVQDFKEGQPNGKYYSWHKSGKKFANGNFNNGELSGKWTWYGNDGLIDSVRSFNQGILNGQYIDYFINGKPQLVIDFLDNKKHGKYSQYYYS